MPYVSIEDLPPGVRGHLPEAAQELFLRAFNGAWRTYSDRSPEVREELAHRTAWSVVKRRYRKLGDVWVPLSTRAGPWRFRG